MAVAVADQDAPESPPSTAAPRSRAGVEALAVVLVSTLAAVVATWPLVTRLGSVVHDLYDPVVQAWVLDWVQHAIRTPSRLFDANVFAPEPDTLAYTDPLIGIALPLLPLRWAGLSPVAQLNAAVILGSALTAASAYVFGRVTTGSRIVATVTGAGFAFGPLATVHVGHVQTVWRGGIPLAAAAAWVLTDRAARNVPTWPPALALFGALAWQASIAFHPTAYAVVAVVVVLAVRWRALGRRGVIAAGLALVCAGGVALVVALPYLANARRFDHFEFGLETLRNYSADFSATDPRVSLWGSLLGKGDGWPAFGGSAFPGALLLALAPLGALEGWRERRARSAAVVGVVLVAVGAILAVGASDRGWKRFTPYRVLFEWVPGWGAIRATDRAWFVGILGLALLAGLGTRGAGRWLAARGVRFGPAVAAAAAAVVVVAEGYAPWTGLPSVRVPAVDHALAALPTHGGVVYLPGNATGSEALDLSLWRQPVVMYGTTAHHRRTPNGFSSYIPPSYARTFARLLSLPDEPALRALRSLDVRYVVMQDGDSGGPWGHLLDPATAAPLRFVGRFGEDLLYEVPAPASVRGRR